MRIDGGIKMGARKTEKITNGISYIFLAALAVLTIFPLIYAIAASFKPMSELFSEAGRILPVHFTLDNYITVFKSEVIDFKTMTFNSIYYTICCVAFVLIASSLNAYVFEVGHFPGRKVLFVVFSSLMFINMGSITVYPLFDILNVIHLNRSLFGLILIKLLGIPIVNIVLVKSYITTLPKELYEAAKIDGCSFTQTFFKIVLPLLKPILATVGVLSFNASWNEFLMPTIFTISNPSQQTLMVGINALKSSGESSSNWSIMLAASVIAVIPVLIAYCIGNKHFVKGLSAGAVKG